VLHCVAVCCSVLQCVAVCCSVSHLVCCSVLQCVAVCCSVLQCVALCCSVLHLVCCSVYHKARARLSEGIVRVPFGIDTARVDVRAHVRHDFEG